MNAEIKQRMDALLNTSARLVLELYIEELIEDAHKDFMLCTKDTFDLNKGRVQALKELLTHVKSRRN